MILIEERTAKKVPGMTSFFINFDYNKQIVDKIASLSCKNYSKKDKE